MVSNRYNCFRMREVHFIHSLLALGVGFIIFCMPSIAEDMARWQPNEKQVRREWVPPEFVGVTPEGLQYSYFPKVAGSVRDPKGSRRNGWGFSCEKDAMSDEKHCWLTSLSNSLSMRFEDVGSIKPDVICTSFHKDPAHQAMIRIDQLPPLTSDPQGCFPGKLLFGQLFAGQKAVIRSFGGGVGSPSDFSEELQTFRPTYNLMLHVTGLPPSAR